MNKRILSLMLILLFIMGSCSDVLAEDMQGITFDTLRYRYGFAALTFILQGTEVHGIASSEMETAFNEDRVLSLENNTKLSLYTDEADIIKRVQIYTNKENANNSLFWAQVISTCFAVNTSLEEDTNALINAADLISELLEKQEFEYETVHMDIDDTGEFIVCSFEYLNKENYTSNDTTLGERNALEKANTYLRISAFSYAELTEQLERDGFTKNEAKYAVDNCNADWMAQAVKKAENYLEVMPLSKVELQNALLRAGFSNKEVEYALHSVGY